MSCDQQTARVDHAARSRSSSDSTHPGQSARSRSSPSDCCCSASCSRSIAAVAPQLVDDPARHRQRHPARDASRCGSAPAGVAFTDAPASDTALAERFQYRPPQRNVRSIDDPDLGRLARTCRGSRSPSPTYASRRRPAHPSSARARVPAPHRRACAPRRRDDGVPPAAARRVLGDHGEQCRTGSHREGREVNGTAVLYHRMDPSQADQYRARLNDIALEGSAHPTPSTALARRSRRRRPKRIARKPAAGRGRREPRVHRAVPVRRRAPHRDVPPPAATHRRRARGGAPPPRDGAPPPRGGTTAARRPDPARSGLPAAAPRLTSTPTRQPAAARPLTRTHPRHESEHDMLRPFLIIGVGGSGGKTLRGIKYQLELKLQQVGWKSGIPAAWQFLHFDTPTAQDGVDFAIPFLPPPGVPGPRQHRRELQHRLQVDRERALVERGGAQDIQRQLPNPRNVKVDVTKGAGQFRAVGRAVALASTKDIATAARGRDRPARRCCGARRARRRSGSCFGRAATGGDGSPTVIVISSIAGGSGAGQFLDIIEVVKSTAKQHPWSNQFFSILYAPDVFDQLNVTAGMPGNALAAIAETMNGFWTESPRSRRSSCSSTRASRPAYGGAMDRVGAAYPFIVGRSNSKVTFEDQSAVYNAVATSLTAWITDERVQDDMIAYSSGNWQARVGANVLPDDSGLASPVHHSPPFSSMGFGRVTLGREKFLEYSAERFARSVDRSDAARPRRRRPAVRAQDRARVDRVAGRQRLPALHQRSPAQRGDRGAQPGHRRAARRRASRADQGRTRARRRPAPQRAAVSSTSRAASTSRCGRTGCSTSTRQRSGELLQRDQRARQVLLDEWIEARCRRTSCTPIAQLHRRDRAARRDRDARPARPHAARAPPTGSRPRRTSATNGSSGLRSLVARRAARRRRTSSRSGRTRMSSRHAIERLTQALGWASEARLRQSASGAARRTARRLPRPAARATSMARSVPCASG